MALPLASDLDQIGWGDTAAQGSVEPFVQGAYSGPSIARSGQEAIASGLVRTESEADVQGVHQRVPERPHIASGQLGALRDIDGCQRDQVSGGDAGAVERGQQVRVRGGVEIREHMQQIRHLSATLLFARLCEGHAHDSQATGWRGEVDHGLAGVVEGDDTA
jgi:hypothetical protein